MAHYCLEILYDEHEKILKLTDLVTEMSVAAIQSGALVSADWRLVLSLIRRFADEQHHGKEEKILFDHMIRELGQVAVTLVKVGMMAEHDMARSYVRDWDTALDRYDATPDVRSLLEVLSHALSYRNLLVRHAERENDVVFPYAQRALSDEILNRADEESRVYEKARSDQRKWALDTLEKLCRKYGI